MQLRLFQVVIYIVLFCFLCPSVNGSDPDSGGSNDIFDSLRYFASQFTRLLGHFGEVLSASVEEDCEFKCPNGVKPRPNIYHDPIGNGCGVAGFQIPSYVPTYKLEKCCDDHDICYGTCGKDKDKCDEKFKKCLYGICSSVKQIMDSEPLNKGCKSVAKAFYMAVVGAGCKYYLDAQKDACVCHVNYYDDEL
ncbi:group XIIA secretory phospholipase A2 [Planococcus citri]|uniref:group XIIA secretory phospholipase A2 n=1 Tax=Planococcus citri TaxID=170843 RepID=UPI0031F8F9D9